MSIIHVGIDVHKNSYVPAVFNKETGKVSHVTSFPASNDLLLKYLGGLLDDFGKDTEIICGYEAGCLGYTLQRFLIGNAVPCIILAPSTMATAPNKPKRKNDKRDAADIAKCLAFNTYSPVNTPTLDDEAVRDFIRMREDISNLLTRVKQQLLAFLLRHDLKFTGTQSNWTKAHFEWLRHLELGDVNQETLEAYLLEIDRLTEKLDQLEKRIDELAQSDPYKVGTGKLGCFLGIKNYTALAVITEIGDFNRFKTASEFAAYVGLIPGEASSGQNQQKLGITKQGNSHVRCLLVESANAFAKGNVGYKSKELKKRQDGQDQTDVAYADRANERLRKKYRKMIMDGKPANVAKTACARELACFIWGMMTGNTQARTVG